MDSDSPAEAVRGEPTKSRLSTAPYKGARDFYPEQQRLHNWIFGQMGELVELFGYEPYNAPMLELLDLYAAKSGRELVQEQVYNFTDRGGREVAVRPEMTPSLARMVAARLGELTFPLRWYSIPNLWRYERPQRGRTREHWQFNVDLIGVSSIQGELEILEVAVRIMQKLGADSKQCQINFSNRTFLNEFLAQELGLDASQSYEVSKAIDRKDKVTPEAYTEMLAQIGLSAEQATKVLDLTEITLAELEKSYADRFSGARDLVLLNRGLQQREIADFCRLNLGVVRGLDYYTGTVFEMYDLNPKNRRALFGGGRYDGLIAMFNGQKMPAVGFGLGDVTITDFLTTHGLLPQVKSNSDVIFVIPQEETRDLAYDTAKLLRARGIRTEVYLEEGTKLAKQFKYADKRGIPVAIMIGEAEKTAGIATVKDLRTGEQREVKLDALLEYLQTLLGQGKADWTARQ